MFQSELKPQRGRSKSFITDNWAQKSLNKPFLLRFAGTFYIVGSALYSPQNGIQSREVTAWDKGTVASRTTYQRYPLNALNTPNICWALRFIRNCPRNSAWTWMNLKITSSSYLFCSFWCLFMCVSKWYMYMSILYVLIWDISALLFSAPWRDFRFRVSPCSSPLLHTSPWRWTDCGVPDSAGGYEEVGRQYVTGPKAGVAFKTWPCEALIFLTPEILKTFC